MELGQNDSIFLIVLGRRARVWHDVQFETFCDISSKDNEYVMLYFIYLI